MSWSRFRSLSLHSRLIKTKTKEKNDVLEKLLREIFDFLVDESSLIERWLQTVNTRLTRKENASTSIRSLTVIAEPDLSRYSSRRTIETTLTIVFYPDEEIDSWCVGMKSRFVIGTVRFGEPTADQRDLPREMLNESVSPSPSSKHASHVHALFTAKTHGAYDAWYGV